MFRFILCLFLVATTLSAQEAMKRNIYLVESVKNGGLWSTLHYDNRKQAVVYCTNGNPQAANDEALSFVVGMESQGIGYQELDKVQYEALCEMFDLIPRPSHTMLVLYFNKKAVQYQFDPSGITLDLSQEFKKLGWTPREERLEKFLKYNPNNQEALAQIFDESMDKLRKWLWSYKDRERLELIELLRPSNPSLATDVSGQLGLQTQIMPNDDDTLEPYIRVLEMIANADNMDWMSSDVGQTSIMSAGVILKTSLFNDSPKFKKALNNVLERIEKEIKRDPYSFYYYSVWGSFAKIAKADPYKILSQINFPSYDEKQLGLVVLSYLADWMFPNIQVGEKQIENLSVELQKRVQDTLQENNMRMIDRGFEFLKYSEEWLENQNNYNATVNDALQRLEIDKLKYLIRYERYNEVEEYLHELRFKTGAEWPDYVKEIRQNMTPFFNSSYIPIDIRNIPNKVNIEEILKLPATVGIEKKKKFTPILIRGNFPKDFYEKLWDALSNEKVHFSLIQDTSLQQDSWILTNMNALVMSGSIVPVEDEKSDTVPETIKELIALIHVEERKNLDVLEKFVRQNPDNHAVMERYCAEAEKFLPDEALENNIYAYSAITLTAPSTEAFSKMGNKDKWSRLISRVIAEGKVKLVDSPIGFGKITRNPWDSLSRWEDLDKERNAIDWFHFLNTTDFWYDKFYYTERIVMPEKVFIKYLSQAEKAFAWADIVTACETRYNGDKKYCRNEQILDTWTRAEQM